MEPVAAVETKTEEEEEMTEETPAYFSGETTSSGNAAEETDDCYDVESGGPITPVGMTEGGSEMQWSEEEEYATTTSTANLDYSNTEEEDEFDPLAPMHSEFISAALSESASIASTTNSHDGTHDHHHQRQHHPFGRSIQHHQNNGERDSAKRISLVTDLSTGKAGGARVQKARVRTSSLSGPQTAGKRLRNSLLIKTISLVNVSGGGGGVGGSGTSSNNQQQQQQGEPTGGQRRAFSGSFSTPELSRHGRYLVSERKMSHGSSDESGDDQLDLEQGGAPIPTQYCLRAVREKGVKARFWAWLGISDSGNVYDDISGGTVCSCFGLSPNTLVTKYLHWTFRTSFAAVFLSGALVFLSVTMLFATIIKLISLMHPTCIGGVDPSQQIYFTDLFILSWTTFSTVGYGAVYPGISSQESNVMKCTGLTIIVSIEAFIGVLYGCFCSAILFIKVSRIQSHAQVVFSDPIVVRYGSGVMIDDGEDAESAGNGSVEGSSRRSLCKPQEIPCPVLEFRLVNRLNWVQGGELLDASLNIVACIDASQVCRTVQNARRSKRHGKKGKRGGPRPRGGGPGLLRARSQAALKRVEKNDTLTKRHQRPALPSATSILSLLRSQQELVSRQAQQEFDEGDLVPRKIFSKLEVESPDHPFFKRTWTACHKLDEYSPLLKTSTREAIKNNGGFWPPELNTAYGVRSSIQFDQILVSFSGTSNADANSVYAQKVYDFVDMNVGYRFANLLYRDANDGSLHVDSRLINDVLEQGGGGGEDLANKPIGRHYGTRDSLML